MYRMESLGTGDSDDSAAGSDGGASGDLEQDPRRSQTPQDTSGSGKRKRTTRACEPCRKRRIKCTGEQPCKGCANTPAACVFRAEDTAKRQSVRRRNKISALEYRLEIVEQILGLNTAEASEAASNKAIAVPKTEAIPGPDSQYSSSSSSFRGSPSTQPQNFMQPSRGHITSYSTNQAVTTPSQQQFGPVNLMKPPMPSGRDLRVSLPAQPAPPFGGSAMMRQPQPAVAVRPPAFQNGPSSHPSRGAMIMDSNGTYLSFFGSTSALGGDNSHNPWHSSPRFVQGVLFGIMKKPPVESSKVKLGDVIPCPPALIQHLVTNYFAQLHPVFPMVDRHTFIYELKRTLDSGDIDEGVDWAFLLLLLSIVTVMLQFTPSLVRWGISIATDVLAHDCLNRAKRMFYEHLDSMHVKAVQALVLMALSATGREGRGSYMWMFSGMAVRMAQEMGLHRNLAKAGISHPIIEAEVEVRARTWFCVLIAETYVSIMSGRPLAIHVTDWDCVYPTGNTEEIQNLLRHVELAGIFASICRFANRARHVDHGIFVEDVRSRLVRWYSILDPSWLDSVYSKWDAKAFMLLMYHSATILFQRVAFSRCDDETCITSAEAVTQMLDSMPTIELDSDNCCVIFPTVPYGIMMTCMVWTTRYFTSADGSSGSSHGNMREVCLRNVRRCLQVFDNMRGLSIQSMRTHRMFTEYLAMKGIRWPASDASSTLSGSSSGIAGGVGGAPAAREGQVKSEERQSNGGVIVQGENPALNETTWWDGLNLFDLAGLGGLPGGLEFYNHMTAAASASLPNQHHPTYMHPPQSDGAHDQRRDHRFRQ